MKVELVGFSQGVSFSNKNETVNYLDFKIEAGRQFRLPVSPETLELLMSEIYSEEEPASEAEKVAEEVPEEEPLEGEEFGGDGPEHPEIDYPESEDDVPSI